MSIDKSISSKKSRNIFRVIVLSVGIFLFLAMAGICIVSYRNTINPSGIIIHHSALPNVEREPQNYLTLIDKIHKKRSYGIFYWGRTYYIGYHYLILPDGTLVKGRPDRCQGAHARGFNSFLGICLIGDFSTNHNPRGELGLTTPTEAQMQTLASLCRKLMDRYAISTDQVFKHNDVNMDTECPGDRFPFQELITKINEH